MSTPLLELDCPNCGAKLGSPGEGGGYVCAHCGQRSVPETKVVVQRVFTAKQPNFIATQAEIDERKREFDRADAGNQRVRAMNLARAAKAASTTRGWIIGGVVFLAIVGIMALAASAAAVRSCASSPAPERTAPVDRATAR